MRGEVEVPLPPLKMVSKPDELKVIARTLQRQDPVLNAAAERLGVSLRQTEDELTRDRLLSTMSQVNCTGGSNGRVIAVLKSDLIDFKLPLAA